MATTTANTAMDKALAEMDKLHDAFVAGQSSRETAMLRIAALCEQKVFDVALERGGKSDAFDRLFVRFRDGKNATVTSDRSLRSRFLKVAQATMQMRDAPVKFSAVLNTVREQHAKLDAGKGKEGAKQPRQLIEAYYAAASEQVKSESTKPIGANKIALVAAKPEREEMTKDERLRAAASTIADALKRLVGDAPAEWAKDNIAPSDATKLRAAREILIAMSTAEQPAAPPAKNGRKTATTGK